MVWPVIGGVAAGLVSGGLGYLANRDAAQAQDRAARAGQMRLQQALAAFDANPNVLQGLNLGNRAGSMYAAGLGVGDPASFNRGLAQFRNSQGFQDQLSAGRDAITGSAAARGLLGSGSTVRGLADYGQRLAQTSYDNYLNRLGNQMLQGQRLAGQRADLASGIAGTQADLGAQAAQLSSGYNISSLGNLLRGLGLGYGVYANLRDGLL